MPYRSAKTSLQTETCTFLPKYHTTQAAKQASKNHSSVRNPYKLMKSNRAEKQKVSKFEIKMLPLNLEMSRV